MRQTARGVKDGSKALFEVNHTVVLDILHLLVGRSFERLSRLHHRDGMSKSFEILRETSLVGAAKEPGCQGVRILGRQLGVAGFTSQFNQRARS